MSNKANIKVAVKTFKGLEQELFDELTDFGFQDLELGRRAVYLKTNMAGVYRINYFSRLALRVLVELKSFRVKNEVQLYQRIQGVDWSDYMDLNMSFAIDTVVYSDYFKHSKFVAYKVKDAVVDQFRERFQKRPSVDTQNPDIRIHVHISQDLVSVSLDSSGESLHKRGYRKFTGRAPLNEVMAAGLIKKSGWDGHTPLIDPMCGSGTILIEAALIAGNIAPGIFRKSFGFEKWKGFNEDLYESVIEEYEDETKVSCEILGCDRDSDMIKIAKGNIENAFLSNKVELKISPFDQLNHDLSSGIIVTNPPYGSRLKEGNMRRFYQDLGSTLKHKYEGWSVCLITEDGDFIKSLGLKSSKKDKVLNGALDCLILKYDLYKGSMKAKKAKRT